MINRPSRGDFFGTEKGDGRLSFLQWITVHRRNHVVALSFVWAVALYTCFVAPGWEAVRSGYIFFAMTVAAPIIFFLENVTH